MQQRQRPGDQLWTADSRRQIPWNLRQVASSAPPGAACEEVLFGSSATVKGVSGPPFGQGTLWGAEMRAAWHCAQLSSMQGKCLTSVAPVLEGSIQVGFQRPHVMPGWSSYGLQARPVSYSIPDSMTAMENQEEAEAAAREEASAAPRDEADQALRRQTLGLVPPRW